jgi:hypothetical protein
MELELKQKKMMQAIIDQQKRKPSPMATNNKSSGEVIAEFKTMKYSIYADEELYEEKQIPTTHSKEKPITGVWNL